MDPEALVRRAEEEQDPEEQAWACTDYWEWKAKGGFTRPDLDARIDALEKRGGFGKYAE